MAEMFLMPKLGMDMEEGTIIKWLKAEGDTVQKGEAFAEIETDKSSVEVEALASGTVLKLYYPEGETIACGEPIAAIGAAGEQAPVLGAAAAPAAEAPKEEAPAAAPAAVNTNPLVEMFLMPKLGMDMEEGVIIKWLKAEGDTVEKGEAFAEIETDKSSVEVESLASGTVLKLYYMEGETITCGEPIAAIGPAGEQAPVLGAAAAPAAEAPKAEAAPAPAPAAKPAPAVQAAPVVPAGGKFLSTPRARRLAQKENIDIRLVPGTGPKGRVVEEDVRAFIANGGANAVYASAKAVRVPEETVKPLTGVRKVTANRMRQSLSEMAQTNTRMDVDMTNMIAFRKQMNARLEKDGVKVSFMDLLVCACAKALIENPQANASLMDDGIHYRNFANVGVAVDTERGLVVPVIKDADVMSIREINAASKALIAKAREGALKPDDMKGGSFTISNLGMFEVDSFTAIVNPPETCILAVGRIAERPVVENGQIVVRSMMNLCLSYDHRLLDGAPAARFLLSIKRYLENPVWLMME